LTAEFISFLETTDIVVFMDCELCGRRAEGRAKVEGSIIAVCGSCAAFGEKIYEAKPVKLQDKPKAHAPDEIYFISNFSSVIKDARESKSLSREQLAAKIKEKVTILERIEHGLRPEKHIAEKIEHELGIRIITSMDSERSVAHESSSEPLTLGDIVTIRQRKK
jgi:putative transcription factor